MDNSVGHLLYHLDITGPKVISNLIILNELTPRFIYRLLSQSSTRFLEKDNPFDVYHIEQQSNGLDMRTSSSSTLCHLFYHSNSLYRQLIDG